LTVTNLLVKYDRPREEEEKEIYKLKPNLKTNNSENEKIRQ
jgi:hypothetical protein